MRWGSSLALASLVVGASCGFHAVTSVDDAGDADLGVTGGEPPDAAQPSASDLRALDPCAGPLLLITVENLHNGDTGGGRIARFGLGDGSGLPVSCPTLSGGGKLAAGPLTVAATAMGHLAVGTRTGLSLVDPVGDHVMWSQPLPQIANPIAVDVFPMTQPGGAELTAIAYVSDGPTTDPLQIERLEVYREDGQMPRAWDLNGVLPPLGLYTYSMTRDPLAPTHLLAVTGSPYSTLWDANMWAATKTAYRDAPPCRLATIHAVRGATGLRVVAVGGYADSHGVYYADGAAAETMAPLGPLKCASGCASIVHAVADPTSDVRFFVLCDATSDNMRSVVRLSTDGTCEPVVGGSSFGAESRLSRLGIAN